MLIYIFEFFSRLTQSPTCWFFSNIPHMPNCKNPQRHTGDLGSNQHPRISSGQNRVFLNDPPPWGGTRGSSFRQPKTASGCTLAPPSPHRAFTRPKEVVTVNERWERGERGVAGTAKKAAGLTKAFGENQMESRNLKTPKVSYTSLRCGPLWRPVAPYQLFMARSLKSGTGSMHPSDCLVLSDSFPKTRQKFSENFNVLNHPGFHLFF